MSICVNDDNSFLLQSLMQLLVWSEGEMEVEVELRLLVPSAGITEVAKR